MGLGRFLGALTGALLVILVMVVWFFPSRDDFRSDNPYWNGVSQAMESYRASPLVSLTHLPPEADGVTLFVVPYEDFTATETARVKDFVAGGGTLVLADDYGYGNRVLEGLGLNMRFSGEVLLDPLVNYRTPAFPRVHQIMADPVTEGVDSLVLNHATGLENVSPDQVLAESSPFSFLDIDGDGTLDLARDRPGPVPVMAAEWVVKGRVIVIADPSLVINSMKDIEGNARLLANLANGQSLFIDQSHLPATDLSQAKLILFGVRRLLTTPLATLLLVVLVVSLALLPAWRRRTGHSPTSLTDAS